MSLWLHACLVSLFTVQVKTILCPNERKTKDRYFCLSDIRSSKSPNQNENSASCGSPVLLGVGAPRMFLLVRPVVVMVPPPGVLGTPLGRILAMRGTGQSTPWFLSVSHSLCCLTRLVPTLLDVLSSVVVIVTIAVSVVPIAVGGAFIPMPAKKWSHMNPERGPTRT